MDEHAYAVIIAGGAGTRFWPASRATMPKQLLPLAGTEPLLRATVLRLRARIPPERVYVATGRHLVDATARLLPEIGREQILAEPVPRNTAPCIAWATATIHRRDPNALVAVFPSDHFIVDEQAFLVAIDAALEGARRGSITTIGIVPTRAETGYGYIEVAEALGEALFRAERFVEKPDRTRALAYLQGKKHWWNAGMFFFQSKLMKDAIEAHLPAVGAFVARADEAAREGREHEVVSREFGSLPSISIDHGVMEKEQRIAVVPGDFGWNDVGSWESAWELGSKDPDGNALPASGIAIDSANNLVVDLTTGVKRKTFALLGVSNHVIVETDDAVLVLPRDRAQDVRVIVDALKAKGRTDLL